MSWEEERALAQKKSRNVMSLVNAVTSSTTS